MTNDGSRQPVRGVAMAVLLISLLGCGVTRPDTRKVETNNQPASSPGPARGLVYFLPTYVPESMEVGKGDVQTGSTDRASYGAVIGRRASDSEFTETVSVSVGETPSDREVGEQERKSMRMVNVGGHQARLVEYETVGTLLDWHQDGLAIGLKGPYGSEDVVVSLARGLRLFAGKASATELGEVPNGYEIVGESRLDSLDRNSYTITFSPAKSDSSEVGVLMVTVVPPGAVPGTYVGSADKLKLTSVRGVPAVLGEHTSRFAIAGESRDVVQWSLAWLEHDDLLVMMLGSMSEAELVRMAEGLEETTEEQWRKETNP